MNEKNIDELFLNEMRMLRKSKNYSEMHNYLKFYERIIENLKEYEDEVKIVEINENPLLPDENFKIYLSSFILFIKDYEYLVFMKSEAMETFSSENLIQILNLFSRYHNKKGIIIIWNDRILSSLLIDKKELYKPYEDILKNLRLKTTEFKDILYNLTKKRLSEKKIEIDRFLIEEFNILDNLNINLNHFYNEKYNSIKKIIPDYQNGKITEEIIILIDDYLIDDMSDDEIKNNLLKLYNFRI